MEQKCKMCLESKVTWTTAMSKYDQETKSLTQKLNLIFINTLNFSDEIRIICTMYLIKGNKSRLVYG